ncbi:stage II sporulation protein M [Tannerella forsythia]
MKGKSFFIAIMISFLIWLLPFIGRIFFIEMPIIESSDTAQYDSVISEITESLDQDNHFEAFLLIFKNNILGCAINIAGGVFLGLGTIINLFINGFASADIFKNVYDLGFGLNNILKTTFSHSFELIGFWVSGAIGLSIAWKLIQFMRGKEMITIHFYKQIVLWIVAVFVIILVAAFVEAYISVKVI